MIDLWHAAALVGALVALWLGLAVWDQRRPTPRQAEKARAGMRGEALFRLGQSNQGVIEAADLFRAAKAKGDGK